MGRSEGWRRPLTSSTMRIARLILAAATAVASTAMAAQSAGLSAEDLVGVHSLVAGMAPQWASDGSRILFATSLGGSELWTVPATGGFPSSMQVEMGKIAFLQTHQPAFSPDGNWLSYISNRTGSAEIYLKSLLDGHEVALTHLGARINSYSWSPDSKKIAFADDKFGGFDIYTVEVGNGAISRLTNDPRYEVFPTWTPDSRQVVYVRLDDRWLDHDILVINAEGRSAPRTIVSDTDFFDYAAGGGFGYPQVSPDGSAILFKSQRSGWVNYWVVPTRGGAPRQIAPEAANQSGARWAPDGKSILYQALGNGTQDLRLVSVAGGAPHTLVKPVDLGFVNNAAWSPDGSRVSYTMESPVAAADLYVVSAGGGEPQQLTQSAGPGYVASSLIRPKKITYRSPDGLSIAAYLYEPTLKAGERAPGILLIHGGPTSSWNDTYQVQAQYLAMHGYAVLLPNIRGSSGYGKHFEDANNGCWGRCDLKDVVAGVEYLKQLPYIEPTRMGITGTSYGGCMTLAAAAFAPGVFQAGIAQSGYADWIQFYQEQEMRHIQLLKYELGPLPKAQSLYESLSPWYHVDSIQTPLFLVHGEGEQLPRSVASRLFIDRLEMHYKPFKYKTYPNENYYIQSPGNVRVLLGDMQEYFNQYLKDNVKEVAR
jgi:dipeptidyl aminopeptidase/acylaminoacyl peptidase